MCPTVIYFLPYILKTHNTPVRIILVLFLELQTCMRVTNDISNNFVLKNN